MSRNQHRWRERSAEREPLPVQEPISRTAINALIGLTVTLIGTGVLSMFTLYVRVASLSDAVATIADNQKRHFADSISEQQYRRDQAAIYDTFKSLATKAELKAVEMRLDDQMTTLRRIEDAVTRPAAAVPVRVR